MTTSTAGLRYWVRVYRTTDNKYVAKTFDGKILATAEASAGTPNASPVIQAAVTDILASTRGGIVYFAPEDFPMTTPIDIPTATQPKPLTLIGHKMHDRDKGTAFHTNTAFPTQRYFLETSGATDLSNKFAVLHIRDLAFYNINFLTGVEAGCLKYDIDGPTRRAITIDGLYGNYMWRFLHLIGAVWWGKFDNMVHEGFNASFIGDFDIKLEKGAHTNVATNPWPKGNAFRNFIHNQNPGAMQNSLVLQAAGYNRFEYYWIDGIEYRDCPILLNPTADSVHENTFEQMTILDTNNIPSPDVRRGGTVVLDGANVFDNHFRMLRIPKYPKHIKWMNGAQKNTVEIIGVFGNVLDVDDAGAGVHNVIKIIPGANNIVEAKLLTTASPTLLRVIDERKGAVTSGLATFSGNASTKIFSIAHGCFAAPAYATALPNTADALGSFVITVDATNVIITYSVAPPSGTNNVKLYWKAEVNN
jgi:hypothetical protein